MSGEQEKLIDAHKKRVDLYDAINKISLEQMKFGLVGQVEYGKLITNILVTINGSGVASIPFLLNYLNSSGVKIQSYAGFYWAASIFCGGILFALFLALLAYYNFAGHVDFSSKKMTDNWSVIRKHILLEDVGEFIDDNSVETKVTNTYLVAGVFGWMSLILFFVATFVVYISVSKHLS